MHPERFVRGRPRAAMPPAEVWINRPRDDEPERSEAKRAAANAADAIAIGAATTCRTGFVVAFSCKGRGVCPSSSGRHMAQTAAHLVDHVIPPVPVRQWVISVPKRLRGMLADRPRAVNALTKIFLAEIERLLLAAAGGTPDADMPRAARPRLGGISPATASVRRSTATCTCGTRVTDGGFVPAADDADRDAPPAFLPARPISQSDLAALGV